MHTTCELCSRPVDSYAEGKRYRPQCLPESTLMATDALTDYLDAACEAARRGAAVLEEWRGRFQIKEKGRFDLVTDADVGAQRAVHAYLAERFPQHGFLG